MQTTYLDVQQLKKTIGERVLFQDVSFSIAERQSVGLVAKNGTGKTTLLNILLKKEVQDSGTIIFRKDIKVGYLEQTPNYPSDITILEAIISTIGKEFSAEIELKAIQLLNFLGLDDHTQMIATLSGGQVKRVALVRVLLDEPDLLILDEPTNHLDLTIIEWLEDYLKRNTKSLLMVTHDRYFLNRVCSVILELDNETMYTYRGNYENYLQRREERLAADNAMLSKMKNLYRKELEWMRRTPQARGGKSRYRQDAFYAIEQKIQNNRINKVTKLDTKTSYLGTKIFEAKNVSKSFICSDGKENKIILDKFNYVFSRYEKMGIIGENGTGKSTFVKLLLGEIQPDEGTFTIGETIKFGYFSQQGMSFNENMRVIDAVKQHAEYIDLGNGQKMTAMQLLNQFLFPPIRQQDYIYKLSGGEKRRLYLCTILMNNPNFLILDEPTNDLDISTLQVLEEFLLNFKGCVIVISHDRYFMDRVVDHLLVFEGKGKINDFPGNYSQYRDWVVLKNKEKKDSSKSIVLEEKKKTRTNNNRKLSYKEKNEFEKLEKEIFDLEQKKQEIERALCKGELSYDQIDEQSKIFNHIKKQLEEKEMRWLELSELF